LKQVHSDLKDSEEKYREIVRNAYDPIFLIDGENGLILEANNKAGELLCCSDNNIAGMHFSELFPKAETGSLREMLQGSSGKDSSVSTSLFGCRKCCRNTPVSISSSTVFHKGKRLITLILRLIPEHDFQAESGCIHMHSEPQGFSPSRCMKGLSHREQEVLTLIASGRTSKQIAETLFISEKTVITHRSRIMHKLNIHKTADLVRYAMKTGLLTEQTFHSL
jgi:PAS domain S-box-containing protein